MTEEKIESPAQEEATEDFAAMLAAHSASSGRLQPGQKVSGTVIAITGDSVFVDMGIKVDGIMERKDILDAEGKESAGPGDSVEAWVIAVSPQEIRLSRSMSGSGVAALEEARDAALPVDGRETAGWKGGSLVCAARITRGSIFVFIISACLNSRAITGIVHSYDRISFHSKSAFCAERCPVPLDRKKGLIKYLHIPLTFNRTIYNQLRNACIFILWLVDTDHQLSGCKYCGLTSIRHKLYVAVDLKKYGLTVCKYDLLISRETIVDVQCIVAFSQRPVPAFIPISAFLLRKGENTVLKGGFGKRLRSCLFKYSSIPEVCACRQLVVGRRSVCITYSYRPIGGKCFSLVAEYTSGIRNLKACRHFNSCTVRADQLAAFVDVKDFFAFSRKTCC